MRKFAARKRIELHRHTESLQVGGNPGLKIFETLFYHVCISTSESEPVCTAKACVLAVCSRPVLPSALAPFPWEAAYKYTVTVKTDQGLWQQLTLRKELLRRFFFFNLNVEEKKVDPQKNRNWVQAMTKLKIHLSSKQAHYESSSSSFQMISFQMCLHKEDSKYIYAFLQYWCLLS